MRKHWESYRKNLEGQEVVIHVDVSIYSDVDDVELINSHVAVVALKLNDSDDKSTIIKVEKALESLLTQEGMGHYVGQIIRDGLITFVYYVQSAEQWETSLKEVLETFKNHEITSETKEDGAWAYYKKILYPTVKEWQKIDNAKVCQ